MKASGASGEARKRRTRVDELRDVGLVEAVVEAESIGRAWRTLAKSSDGVAPTCSDGLSGALQLREARLDRGVAPL